MFDVNGFSVYNNNDNNIIVNQITKEDLFTKTFHLPFHRLKKQNDMIQTDDGCTHYMDMQTNIIYSYDFITNEWVKLSKKYQKSLKELFL